MEELRKFYKEKSAGVLKVGFGEKPALLIIDMQNDFAGSSNFKQIIPNIKSLIEKSRKVKIPIIYTRGAFTLKGDEGLWIVKFKAHRERKVQIEGTKGAEIIDDLKPQPEDIIITKRRPSAFYSTDLDVFLKELKVDTLIVVGTSISGCVRATVTDAFMRDYRTIVPRECVVDTSEYVYEANLFDINAKRGDVVGLDEVLAYLDKLARATIKE